MLRRQHLSAATLALLAAGGLAACAHQAPPASQTVTAAPPPSAPPPQAVSTATRDAKAIEALAATGRYLRSLKHYTLRADSTTDRVSDYGQAIQFSHHTDVSVQTPNRLRATVTSGEGLKELVYDGKTFTLYGNRHRFYSTAAAPANIDGLIDELTDRYGIELPLADLFNLGTPRAPLDQIRTAIQVGRDTVGGKQCEHYAYQLNDVDWQVWITSGPKPLPCKLIVTSREDEARPQHAVQLNWTLNPRFTSATFHFTPPKGAHPIPMKRLDASSAQ